VRASLWNGALDGASVYLGTPMADYRADPCPAPSLNSSVARLALFKSLAHAKAAHPRLAEPWDDEADEDEAEAPRITRAMDIGSAAHSLAFGVGAGVAVIHAPNWKRKASQEAAKAARSAGEIPLLAKEYRRAKAMADIARPVIADLLDGSLVAEAMIVCQEGAGFWRRGLIDRMRADARVIIDYKTTELEVSPAAGQARVFTAEHYFQEAFYRRILDTLDPGGRGRRRFCFLYQEQHPPFSLVLIETDEAGRTWGEEQVEAACNLWNRALVTGDWPGHPLGPHIASPPSWLLDRWARRAESDEALNPPHLEFA
jgi:hypothetical protein